MFFRSPFLRLFAYDFEHMMNRSLLSNEMIMRQELERAMNTFAALEQQSIESARPSRASNAVKGKEAEAKIEAPKEGENKTDSLKAKESEQKIESVKPKESESKVDSLKAKESEELNLQQPARRDVFSPWSSSFGDFFGDISPFGFRHRSIFDRFDAIERYADEMRANMDRQFKMAEENKEYPTLRDPENTSYFMRMETNDNGNVKVKTMQKTPGTDWVTKFEEYKRNNNAAIEKDASSETKQAIENKEKPVEIADETHKPSESASQSA